MSRWIAIILMATSFGVPAGYGQQAIELDPQLAKYLTKDGKLTQSIEVRDEERGFGVFMGTIWSVNTEGAWTVTTIFRNQPTIAARGQLSNEQIVQLAKALALYDPLTLANVGRPLVNPHVLVVNYGGAGGVMTFGVDQVPPVVVATEKAGNGQVRPATAVVVTPVPLIPGVSIDAESALIPRYGGILTAVRGAIDASNTAAGNAAIPYPRRRGER